MAALALPISQLEPIRLESRKAQAETECVVVCSRKETPDTDTATVWHIAYKTLGLRRRLSRLTGRQAKFIDWLTTADYTRTSASDLEKLAAKLDELIADEREILRLANSLGSEIRAWWRASLTILADQVEHLESLTESLHVAANPECTSLMAVALEAVV